MPVIHQRIIAAIDALAAELLEFSHAIHAHPEVAFKEEYACGLLRETLQHHGLAASTGVYGLETSLEMRFLPGAGPHGRAARRIRCVTGGRPCVRAQCDRDGVAGRDAGAACGGGAAAGYREAHRHAGRGNGRRQGTDGTRRGFRGHRRRADDPPGRGQPAGHAHHWRGRGQSDLPRSRGACLCAAAPGHQCAGCAGAGLPGHRQPAPAHPGQRTHPRHHHRRREGAEHRAGARRRLFLRARGHCAGAGCPEGPRAGAASRRAPAPRAASSTSSGTTWTTWT